MTSIIVKHNHAVTVDFYHFKLLRSSFQLIACLNMLNPRWLPIPLMDPTPGRFGLCVVSMLTACSLSIFLFIVCVFVTCLCLMLVICCFYQQFFPLWSCSPNRYQLRLCWSPSGTSWPSTVFLLLLIPYLFTDYTFWTPTTPIHHPSFYLVAAIVFHCILLGLQLSINNGPTVFYLPTASCFLLQITWFTPICFLFTAYTYNQEQKLWD